MTVKAKLAAFRELHGADGVLCLGHTEAVALAGEIDVSACRHPEKLSAALAQLSELDDQPTEPDALLAWAESKRKALAAFWDAFEGEIVDGVTIIGKRAQS